VESMKRMPLLIQLSMIIIMSAAASYAFIYTETTIQLNGLCFYRYAAYIAAIFLGYLCFSYYRKYVAFAFSATLILMALSPFGIEVIRSFPFAVPFLTALMGVTAILVVPKSRGKGFFEFLVVLVLPGLLTESRIGGSVYLIATIRSIGYYGLSLVAVIVVGGFFYLRYAALANLNKAELLSNGGAQKAVAEADKLCNNVTARILLGACGAAGILMVAVPTATDILGSLTSLSPFYVLALEMIAGIAMIVVLYILRFHRKESSEQSQK